MASEKNKPAVLQANTAIQDSNEIRNKIYTIRNQQVMLDSDLALMYQVETKRLNERVKRNIARFPENFCFQLTKDEYDNLRSQIATSSEEYGGRRYLPYVFTEQVMQCCLNASVQLRTVISKEIAVLFLLALLNCVFLTG